MRPNLEIIYSNKKQHYICDDDYVDGTHEKFKILKERMLRLPMRGKLIAMLIPEHKVQAERPARLWWCILQRRDAYDLIARVPDGWTSPEEQTSPSSSSLDAGIFSV